MTGVAWCGRLTSTEASAHGAWREPTTAVVAHAAEPSLPRNVDGSSAAAGPREGSTTAASGPGPGAAGTYGTDDPGDVPSGQLNPVFQRGATPIERTDCRVQGFVGPPEIGA